jgi:hypothetical protein
MRRLVSCSTSSQMAPRTSLASDWNSFNTCRHLHLTQGVFKVILQKSISTQIRQLLL